MKENDESIRAVDLIQKALFRSIQEKEFVQISISFLCEKAGVSRTTFYKHYHNTYEVLDAVLERILSGVDTLDHEVLGLHAKDSTQRRIPLCELARRDEKILRLFKDETVTKQLVDKIIAHNMQGMIGHRNMTRDQEEELYSIFHSLAYGCLALITRYGHQEEETFRRMRSVRDGFVAAGLNQMLETKSVRRLYIRTSTQDHVLSLPAQCVLKELRLQEETEHTEETEILRQALQNTKGKRLEALVHPGEKVALITDDGDAFPARSVLPVILRELNNAGVQEEDITIVFATGLHVPLSKKKMEDLVGRSIVHQYRCVCSDPEDYVDLGATVRGTPIQITRVVAEADRRICLGQVSYSSLCGYTGGLNSMMPGCASRKAILMNHKELCSYRVCPGVRKGNPIYEDLREAAHHLNVDFMFNVVLNTHGQIVFASAGEPSAVHEAAITALDSRYRRIVSEEADVVVVGSSMDATLKQLVASARNVYSIVKRGGTVVLVGSCEKGLGNKAFADRFLSSSSPESVLHEVCTEFEPDGAAAGVLARLCLKANVLLVSDLSEGKLQGTMLTPARSVQAAVDGVLSKKPRSKVLIVQEGSRILPEIKEK